MSLIEQIRLKRDTSEIKKKTMLQKIILLALTVLILIVGIIYLFALFYKSNGSFTVSLNRYQMLQTGISLSDKASFEKPSSRLEAPPLINASNISQKDLPDYIDKKEGDYSTSDFVAYTYFVRNSGKSTFSYNSTLKIDYSSLGIDKAIRIMFFDNGVPTTYAAAKSNGTPELDTVPFQSETVVFSTTKNDVPINDVNRYTVVIWLEGNDPECIDEIIGGTIKLSMDVAVIENN